MRRQIGSKKRRGLRLERFEQREMLTGIDELRASVSDIYDPNDVVVYVDGFETRLTSQDFIQYITRAGGIDSVVYEPAPVRITTVQPLEFLSLNALNNFSELGHNNSPLIRNSPQSNTTPQLADFRTELFASQSINANSSIASQGSYHGTVELSGTANTAFDENVVYALSDSQRGTFWNDQGMGALLISPGQIGDDLVIRNDLVWSRGSDNASSIGYNSSGFEYDSLQRSSAKQYDSKLQHPLRYKVEGSEPTFNFGVLANDSDSLRDTSNEQSQVPVFESLLNVGDSAIIDLATANEATETVSHLAIVAQNLAYMPKHMLTPAQQQVIHVVSSAEPKRDVPQGSQSRLRLVGIVGQPQRKPMQLTTLASKEQPKGLGADSEQANNELPQSASDEMSSNRVAAILRFVKQHAEEVVADEAIPSDELLAEILRLRNAQASELESEESVSEDHSSRDLVIASLGLFGAGLVINEFAVDSRESQKSQASLRKRRPR